jgi:Arm DNA-binding domain/Phage integrase family
MSRQSLTKTSVDRLLPRDADYVVWDAAIPGFGVRVKPTGVKSALVQYRSRRTSTSRRKTLGQIGPLLTLHQARNQARVLLAEAIRGEDPVLRDKAHRVAPTMQNLADDYLTRHAIPKKRSRSVTNEQGMLARHILPRLGGKRVEAVVRRDIETLHNSLQDTPYQANRVLSLLSKMFSLAIAWGWRPDNPAKGIERFAEARRERWLSEIELGRLLGALDQHPNQRAASAIRLQLLTGARIGEVLQARWRDIDLQRGVWIKPSHHTKQKRTEHLPLSGHAVALLACLSRRRGRKASAGHQALLEIRNGNCGP